MSHDDTWPYPEVTFHYTSRAARRRLPFYLLILVLLSTGILLIFNFQLYSNPYSTFSLASTSATPPPSFSIELHPKDHIQRLPTTITHHWTVTKGYRSPDGVRKLVYLINGTHSVRRYPAARERTDVLFCLAGQFPGPTIEARPGDGVVVHVSNQLEGEEGIAIHWHGLHMRG